MVRRIENPSVDDLGQGGVVLTGAEFEDFLDVLVRNGADDTVIAAMRLHGFFAPIRRDPSFEWAFKAYGMQSDIKIMAICREDSLEGMKTYITFLCREGSWPKGD
jgi:hypothetical protein